MITELSYDGEVFSCPEPSFNWNVEEIGISFYNEGENTDERFFNIFKPNMDDCPSLKHCARIAVLTSFDLDFLVKQNNLPKSVLGYLGV